MIPAVPSGQHAYCLPCRGQAAQQGIDLIDERTVAMRSSRPELLIGRCTLNRGPSGSKPSCCGVTFSYRPYLPH